MCWCQFLLLVALCALLLAGCGAYGVKVPSPLPTTSAAAGAAAEEAYLAGLAEHGALTGSVLIARGGQVLLSRGYGLADEASQAANTPETRFRIGSNTKQFTAAAILLLQEHGKLSVQDTVCKYIPDCPEAWRPMTLHHLLTHTSGIPDYINSPGFPALIGTPATPEELIARFRNWPLLFAPGTRWSYSNSGYTLLGYVIERVSGESYAQFLQDNIFGPLGMTNTSSDSNTPQPPAHATGYLSAGVQPVYLDMSEFYAAGALASTVEDMLRWDEALLTHRVLSQASLEAMVTPYVACPAGGCALASDVGYGYGWFVAQEDGQRIVYHWGRIDGFRSSNGFYPDKQVIVVVLSNLETTDVWGISHRLGQMVVGS